MKKKKKKLSNIYIPIFRKFLSLKLTFGEDVFLQSFLQTTKLNTGEMAKVLRATDNLSAGHVFDMPFFIVQTNKYLLFYLVAKKSSHVLSRISELLYHHIFKFKEKESVN